MKIEKSGGRLAGGEPERSAWMSAETLFWATANISMNRSWWLLL